MKLKVPALFHTQNWLLLDSEKSYPMRGDKVIKFLREQQLKIYSITEQHVEIELNSTQYEELKKVVDAMKNYWFELTKNNIVLKCF